MQESRFLLLFGILFSEVRRVSLKEALSQKCAGLLLPLMVGVPGDRYLGMSCWGTIHGSLKWVMGSDAGG